METIYSLFSLFTSKHKDSSVKYFLLKMKPTELGFSLLRLGLN